MKKSIAETKEGLNLGERGEEITGYDGYISDAFQEIADDACDIYNSALLEWVPGHEGDIKEASSNGLLEGCEGDIYKMIQAAQFCYYETDLYEHREDILLLSVCDYLENEGVYNMEEDKLDAIVEFIAEDDIDTLGELQDAVREILGLDEEGEDDE